MQLYPISTIQFEAHPSLEVGFASSQLSGPTMIPSPQKAVHIEGDPVQVHPDSTEQVAEQPSDGPVFESSHPSFEAIKLSPHVE